MVLRDQLVETACLNNVSDDIDMVVYSPALQAVPRKTDEQAHRRTAVIALMRHINAHSFAGIEEIVAIAVTNAANIE